MMIQGRDGDQTEARRLSRRVILGQKTTLSATDLRCHFYERKPQARARAAFSAPGKHSDSLLNSDTILGRSP
jgi:hypothetical protein